MKKKLVGILIITLFITTAILPVTAYSNTNNQIICKQEEEETPDSENLYIIEWIYGIIRGYTEGEIYYTVEITITVSFVFGVDYDIPICRPAIRFWERMGIKKDEFTGTLTQSRIMGKIVTFIEE